MLRGEPPANACTGDAHEWTIGESDAAGRPVVVARCCGARAHHDGISWQITGDLDTVNA